MLNYRAWVFSALLIGIGAVVSAETKGPAFLPNLFPYPNATGNLQTFSATGKVDLTGPFFQSLGTNGRSCSSCHQPGEAWSVSAAGVAERFERTEGSDPIFRTNDGSNCDHDVQTSTVEGRRQAYSLLINHGLFRVALAVPTDAEFDVVHVNNPYGCAETSTLSMYRRPLPSSNLRFLSTLMWDGRESSTQTGTKPIAFETNPADLLFDLAHQAVDATNGHAEGATPLTAHQQQQIVAFEMGLSTAQAADFGAGSLSARGAMGGPVALFTQPFYVGINDPLGQNPFKTPFTPVVFTLFDTWSKGESEHDGKDRRASIVRGETLFNSRPISITEVGGLNDATGQPRIAGTCGTCHDAPNVGNHSVSAPLNIGVADVTSALNLGYLPVITLRKKSDPTQEITTTDPGRALVTGQWAGIGKFKGPVLRGLSARPPYFHNGSAAGLKEVIEFNTRFEMGLTEQEKADLIAFLSAL